MTEDCPKQNVNYNNTTEDDAVKSKDASVTSAQDGTPTLAHAILLSSNMSIKMPNELPKDIFGERIHSPKPENRRNMRCASVERSLQTLREVEQEPHIILSFEKPACDDNDTEWYKRRQKKKLEERARLMAKNTTY